MPPDSGHDRPVSTLRLRGVVRGFDTPAGRVTALKGVSLEARPGEFVALVGKSGSGKSVLLRLVAGLDRPDSGQIEVNGTSLGSLTERPLTQWRRASVGIVLQDHQLFDSLSVLDNVRLPMDFAVCIPPAERDEQARERLVLVGMLNFAKARPPDLSVGQRRRVALAQALANNPGLLLADEPTLDLDPMRAAAVFGLFSRLAEAGKSVIMATRDYELAMRAGRTIVISDGEIVSQHVAEAFPKLDPLQLSAAAERLKPLRYAPGQVVFRQGERSERFFVIVKGQAEVSIDRPDGAPIHLNTLSPGQYFGEIGLLRGSKRTATVRAGSASALDVLALGKDALTLLLNRSEGTHEQMERSVQERLLSDAEISLPAALA